MVMLKWDEDTKRLYENGVDNGVLYLKKQMVLMIKVLRGMV